MNKEALFYALRGAGFEDLHVKFGIPREDAKRIVWAVHGRRRGQDAQHVEIINPASAQFTRIADAGEDRSVDGVSEGRR